MPAQNPNCPSCKKPMRQDRPFTDFETKQEEIGIGRPFPSQIEMTMFQNYICYDCGTRIRQAVQVATYKNPEIKDVVLP